jgi:hypothetical protein
MRFKRIFFINGLQKKCVFLVVLFLGCCVKPRWTLKEKDKEWAGVAQDKFTYFSCLSTIASWRIVPFICLSSN